MALWDGLGQAATLAQLAGVDAAGLITMIVQAAQTVRRNKHEAEQLGRRVLMISDLLQSLDDSQTMQDPSTRNTLEGLEETLREAYMLIVSCQGRSFAYRFFMGGKLAQQFREVQDKIDSYLLVYPVISHISITRRLKGLCNGTNAQHSQVTNVVVDSYGGCSTPDVYNTVNFREAKARELNDQRISQPVEPTEAKTRDLHKQRLPRRVELTGFREYDLAEVAEATNNFSVEIGRGGFGTVYWGQLRNGFEVAVKRHSFGSYQSSTEFWAEVEHLRKLHHINIIKLLGYCTEKQEKILIYEYMLNGSLTEILHEGDKRKHLPFDWVSRMRIIQGVVQGIVYLHKYSGTPIVHRDLKPDNIIFDYDMNPKITDFGLSILCPGEYEDTDVCGTVGYVDPVYRKTLTSSTFSDVFSFGVMLLEIITAKKSVIRGAKVQYITDYVWDLWSKGRYIDLIDPSMDYDELHLAMIHRCMQIALLCVQDEWADRPSMSDVHLMLNCESMILPVPRRT